MTKATQPTLMNICSVSSRPTRLLWIMFASRLSAPEFSQRPPPRILVNSNSRSVAGRNKDRIQVCLLKWLGFQKAIRASTSVTNIWIELAREGYWKVEYVISTKFIKETKLYKQSPKDSRTKSKQKTFHPETASTSNVDSDYIVRFLCRPE